MAHQVMRLRDRGQQHSGQCRQRRPERKGSGIDPIHIDPKGPRRAAIHLRGAHHQPGAAACQPPPHRQQHQNRRPTTSSL